MTEKYIKNYINGALVPALSGDYLDNINPANGKVYAHFPDSNESDLKQAVEVAERVQSAWARIEDERRFRLLMRIADILEQNLIEFARAETLDTGKPVSMAVSNDVPDAQACFRYYATSIMHQQSASKMGQSGYINLAMRQPIGIVACIIPWNMPLFILCQKVAAALAAGNCVIVKPSEHTPMTAYMLSQACEEAGLPSGVLNVVHGRDEVLHPLIAAHPKIEAISFTGNVKEGKRIVEAAAPFFKKMSLNQGGNNANIIFDDCDFDKMMIGTLRSSFSNNGQLRHHASRIFVERSKYETFKQELVKRTQFLKVGDPFSSITDLGAIISANQLEEVKSYLRLAEVEGGNVLCGGRSVDVSGELDGGYFILPAIVEGLANDAKLNQEEVFAPIVSLQPFDTVEEVIDLVNDSKFGLSASIWTKHIAKATAVAERLKVGTVWINAWMTRDITVNTGGIRQSGNNFESGMDGLEFFTERKHINFRH